MAADAPAGGRWTGLALAAAGLLVVLGRDLWLMATVRWYEADGYYGHAPLVLAVSAWLLWRDRAALARLPRRPTAWGLVVLAAAVGLHGLGVVGRISSPSQYAALLGLAGCALALHGAPLARRTWFPCLYAALFAIPLPRLVLNELTLGLKLQAARLATAILDLAGVAVVRQGGALHFAEGHTVLVDDVCSGLRSLVAILALVALFAHLQPTRRRAGVLLALAVPIALAANAARLLLLCWLAKIGHPAASEGPLHEATGVAVYAVALGVVLAIHATGRGEARRPPVPDVADRPPGPGPRAGVGVLLVAGLALTVPGRWLGGVASPPARTPAVSARIPVAPPGWSSEDLVQPAQRDRFTRAHQDVVFRRYRRPDLAAPVELYVVAGGDLSGVRSRPGCYDVKQGMREVQRAVVALETPAGPVPAYRALILTPDGRRILAYYWHVVDGEARASVLATRLVSGVAARLTGTGEGVVGGTVRITTPIDPGSLEAAESRIHALSQAALGAVVTAFAEEAERTTP